MKAIKFIDNDNGNITIEEYEKDSEKWSGSHGNNNGMVSAMIAEILRIRYNVDLNRLEDKDVDHINKIASTMLLIMKAEYKYIVDEFYDGTPKEK